MTPTSSTQPLLCPAPTFRPFAVLGPLLRPLLETVAPPGPLHRAPLPLAALLEMALPPVAARCLSVLLTTALPHAVASSPRARLPRPVPPLRKAAAPLLGAGSLLSPTYHRGILQSVWKAAAVAICIGGGGEGKTWVLAEGAGEEGEGRKDMLKTYEHGERQLFP